MNNNLQMKNYTAVISSQLQISVLAIKKKKKFTFTRWISVEVRESHEQLWLKLQLTVANARVLAVNLSDTHQNWENCFQPVKSDMKLGFAVNMCVCVYWIQESEL